VTDDGGQSVTDRGIYWNITSPAENGTQVSNLSGGTGLFEQTIDSLPTGTQIFFKAYATNSVDTSFSTPERSFTTDSPPTVSADAATDINANDATLGGSVTDDGGAVVTENGIVWNITSPAETGGTVVPMGSGTPFTQTVSSLPAGTLIYFKAYATNAAGTGYSTPESSFTTAAGLATLLAPSKSGITANSAVLGGDVDTDGGATVTENGIVWNTTTPPEAGGTVVPIASGLAPFSTEVFGLPQFSR
jgi:hypothetical protein